MCVHNYHSCRACFCRFCLTFVRIRRTGLKNSIFLIAYSRAPVLSKIERTLFFLLPLYSPFCTFVEDMMRFGIDNSGKTLFSRFVSALTFLYLCIRYDAVRQCQIWKNKVSPISLCAHLSVSLQSVRRKIHCAGACRTSQYLPDSSSS